MIRVIPAGAVVLALWAGQASAQGVVTGRIFDDYTSQPLQWAYIDLYQEAFPETRADSNGTFVLRGVPPGDHVVNARALGYNYDFRFVRVESGDSIHLDFRLGPILDLISVDMAVPEGPLLTAAATLLPMVRAHPDVLTSIMELAAPRADTVLVWVPWTKGLNDTTVLNGATLVFKSDCVACVSEEFWTIEGQKYRPGVSHVTIGVFTGYTQTPMLRFCVFRPAILSGWNCPGSGALLSFARWPDGTWKVVPRWR